MTEDQTQRYIRWQDIRIRQLSFSINMFLGLAVASLGFSINVTMEYRIPLLVILIPFFLWLVSGISGCIATLSRLVDFRYTAKKIKEGDETNTSISKGAGPVTWMAFYIQTIT